MYSEAEQEHDKMLIFVTMKALCFNLSFLHIRVYRDMTIAFPIQDATSWQLEYICAHILGNASSYRTYALASDCTWNTRWACFVLTWIDHVPKHTMFIYSWILVQEYIYDNCMCACELAVWEMESAPQNTHTLRKTIWKMNMHRDPATLMFRFPVCLLLYALTKENTPGYDSYLLGGKPLQLVTQLNSIRSQHRPKIKLH